MFYDYFGKVKHILSSHSQSIEQTNLLVDQPWVLVDKGNETNIKQKYIFRSGGDLLISMDGVISDAKWEYLPTAKSLIITSNHDKILYKHGFFDKALMVLQLEAKEPILYTFANENYIPDLNVKGYVFNKITAKLFEEVYDQINGGKISVLSKHRFGQPEVGMKAYAGYEFIEDGVYTFTTNQKVTVENGIITKIMYLEKIVTSDGITFHSEQKDYYSLSPHDILWTDTDPAPTGKFEIGFMNYMHVLNGRFIKTTWFF